MWTLALWSPLAFCEQSGSIEGTVVWENGVSARDIRVVVDSDVMPRVRTVTTDESGRYQLISLIPGNYVIVFTSPNGASSEVAVSVLLGKATILDLVLRDPQDERVEELVVVGDRVSFESRASLSNTIHGRAIGNVPVGTDYRDLLKLAPGVQFTQDSVRGPSAGGSGQDNVYRFDGVDVTLPMFGTLSSEPSSHDIDQVRFVRGGVSATGFNRSGGFTMDSTSKSGSEEFRAEIEYVTRPSGLTAKGAPPFRGSEETEYDWFTVNGRGPLIPSRLFGYGSIFRPSEVRSNKATAYGPVKDYLNTRTEYFAKLTYVPSDSLLIHASYRTSQRTENGVSIGPLESDSVSVGGRSDQDILRLEGSWATPAGPTISLIYGDYKIEGSEQPDLPLDVQPRLDGSLRIESLDQMGHLSVPRRLEGMDEYNVAVEPIIQQYGYLDESGARTGGGAVGAYPQINTQGFFRRGLDLNIDHEITLGSTTHELHFGFRRTVANEKLLRLSNGWGRIDVPGGVDRADDGSPIFYVATVQQMSLRQDDGSVVGPINSYTESTSIELNDKVRIGNLVVSAGILVSQDTLYGQGLRRASGTYSGFEVAPGEKYRMYTIRWKDLVQPRLGLAWRWNEDSTVFANMARYNPEVNSLARAASWDRNTRATVRVLFDESGRIIDSEPLPGSSGKVFQDNLTPRQIDEWTIGLRRSLTRRIVVGGHLRRREAAHFWEDTWNLSRTYDTAPSNIASKGAYVSDLGQIRQEIGGSSYVIAELDDAYTNYWEVGIEGEWRGEQSFLSATYTRSRYTGNFDQDNTSGFNDANLFIGSSNLADGYGRQLWDKKDGVLRGDRPHILKVFGYRNLPWNATAGVYSFFQSGQPWEAWDATSYGLPSYFSSTIRYAEPAGARRSSSHWQVDLSYTQQFLFVPYANTRLRLEIFNLFDRQTGYNFDPYRRSATFGMARNHFQPRHVHISVALEFPPPPSSGRR